MALKQLGLHAKSYTGRASQNSHRQRLYQARILSIDEHSIRADLSNDCVVVVAGFQGMDESGSITTLGRGGSDTTGVAIAAALRADECQIYTDVDGVYTTDPRMVPEARRLKSITFEEMLEMAKSRLQSIANSFGRVRRKIQGQATRAVQLCRRGRGQR